MKAINSPRLVISHDPLLATVTVTIGILLGSRNEVQGKFGLVHLLEHMIFRGSSTHPSKQLLLEPLIDVAAKFNGDTERDMTIFYATVLAEDVQVALTVLIEMIKQPLIDPQDLEIEKQAVVNEIKSNESVPLRKLESLMLLPNVLHNFADYYHDVTGIVDNVNRATQQDLIDLFTNSYCDPNKIVISVNGNLSKINGGKKWWEQRIQHLWNAIPYSYSYLCKNTNPCIRQPTTNLSFLHNAQAGAASLVETTPGISETFVGLGWISAAFETDESYILDWISAYLTGTLLSVLYLRLREQTGYVYHVSSEQYNLDYTGVFLISWQLAKPDRVNETLEMIQEELSNLKRFNDTNQLRKWQKWIVRRFQMNMQDSAFLATLYNRQMLLRNRIRTVEEIVDLYNQITCTDIQRVSCKVFTSKSQTLAALLPA